MQGFKVGGAVALLVCSWHWGLGCVDLSGLSDGTDQAPRRGDVPSDGGQGTEQAPPRGELPSDSGQGADQAPPRGDVPSDGGQDATGTDATGAPTTLTVTLSGSGTGNVGSQDLGVDCGGTCSHLYARGTGVTLTATPLTGSAFIGWGAPCSGTGACVVMMKNDVQVDAAFGLKVLDIDGNRAYESADDATLISRYLFGQTGPSLTNGAIGANATRSDPAVVLSYLNSIRTQLDVDGNGQPDALTDGIMIQRYMSGTRGDALTANAIGSGATRTTSAQVEAYLQALTP